jgi:hypothetical protein
MNETHLANILKKDGYRLSPENRVKSLSKPLGGQSRQEQEKHAQPQVLLNATAHSPRRDYKSELIQQCELIGLRLEPEFKFHPERRFRADWLIVGYKGCDVRGRKVLVEFEGGLFSSGKRGHSSVAGILRDMSKANEAQILGFIVIRIAPSHVVSGEALTWIENAILSRVESLV